MQKTHIATPTREDIEAEINRVFGKNGTSFIYILTVCRENSGLDPHSMPRKNSNGSQDVGVAQINTVGGVRVSNGVTYTIEQLLDYRTNIKVAYEIFERRGNWKAWYGCRDHNGGVYPPVY